MQKNGNKAPAVVSRFDSSAGGTSTSVKTGPRVSKNMAAALNGPKGTGALPDMTKGRPALVVLRKGSMKDYLKGRVSPVSTVSASEMVAKAKAAPEVPPARPASPGASKVSLFVFRSVNG